MERFRKMLNDTGIFFRYRFFKTFALTFAAYAAIILGGIRYVNASGTAYQVMSYINQVFSEIEIGEIGPDGRYHMNVILLALHNMRAGAIATFSGLIPFLYIPAFLMVMNARLVGLMLGAMPAAGIGTLEAFVFTILPHGIFELPANIMGNALGIFLCTTVIRYIFKKQDRFRTAYDITGAVRVFFFVIVPLLAIAAPMETYVTPWVMSTFLGVG